MQLALSIIDTYRFLTEKKKEYILSKQLLRSGTSVGANIEESLGGYSRKEYLYKLSIAYREARECAYWLRLLEQSGYLKAEEINTPDLHLDEVSRILYSILRRHEALHFSR